MKNVGDKPETLRRAVATAELSAPDHCLSMVERGESDKGDPAASARVAGILAAKRTDEILPLCHPLPLQNAEVHFEVRDTDVLVTAEAATIGPTGVEMEALTAATVAALTLYDMLKPYTDPEALSLTAARVTAKTGGKSQFKRTLPFEVPAAVIVLSDTVAAGDKPDTAGETVAAGLREAGFAPVDYTLLPDEPDALADAIKGRIAAGPGLIATVGGTGIGPRDQTVETAAPFITTEMPGLMEAARAFGQRRTPYAMMSRGIAGFAENSLLITFPGSRKGAGESLDALLPGLVHIFEVHHNQPHAGGYA